MSRTGLLVVFALIFALAAAGVLVWTNNLELPGVSSPPSTQTVAGTPNSSREAQLVKFMNEVASGGGGFAATFQPDDKHKWNIDTGHQLERFRFGDTGVTFARLSSTVPLAPDVVHLGVAVFWPPELTNRFNGRTVEIGIIARAATSNPSPTLATVFATRQAGNSGWNEFQLSPQFELLRFTYEVPAQEQGYQAEPMLVLHADMTGKGRAVEVLGFIVRDPQK